VDPRVKATWDYENRHGIYKKGASSPTWAGWQTYQREPGRFADVVDITGRAPELQPGYLKQQRREAFEKRNK